MKKPCIVCGAPTNLGSRCTVHAIVPRGHLHNIVRAQVLAHAVQCNTCGFEGSEENPLTLGHIVPRAAGGDTSLANTMAQCLRCNLSAGATVS